MKHIKAYEELGQNEITRPEKDEIYYYKINVKKSIGKFDTALRKLGVRQKFYKSDQNKIKNYLDMVNKNSTIYLIVDSCNFFLYNRGNL